jgi:hypothetical protein
MYTVKDMWGDRKDDPYSMPPVQVTPWDMMPEEETQARAFFWVQVFRYHYSIERYRSDYALDEVTRGVYHLFKNFDEVPIWVSFGMQVSLDIQGALGDCLENPFHEMQSHVRRMCDEFDQADFNKPFDMKYVWHRKPMADMKDFMERAKGYGLEDRFGKHYLYDPDKPLGEDGKPDAKFCSSSHPVLGVISPSGTTS